jgi:hypothetical protein
MGETAVLTGPLVGGIAGSVTGMTPLTIAKEKLAKLAGCESYGDDCGFVGSVVQDSESLLDKRGLDEVTIEESELAAKFWNAISQYIPERQATPYWKTSALSL